jgi:hypothetical protein
LRSEGGKKLAKASSVLRFPTMVVLTPDMDRLHVVGCTEGELSTAQVDGVLRNVYDSDGYRTIVGAPPNLLSVAETMLNPLGIPKPSKVFYASEDR